MGVLGAWIHVVERKLITGGQGAEAAEAYHRWPADGIWRAELRHQQAEMWRKGQAYGSAGIRRRLKTSGAEEVLFTKLGRIHKANMKRTNMNRYEGGPIFTTVDQKNMDNLLRTMDN